MNEHPLKSFPDITIIDYPPYLPNRTAEVQELFQRCRKLTMSRFPPGIHPVRSPFRDVLEEGQRDVLKSFYYDRAGKTKYFTQDNLEACRRLNAQLAVDEGYIVPGHDPIMDAFKHQMNRAMFGLHTAVREGKRTYDFETTPFFPDLVSFPGLVYPSFQYGLGIHPFWQTFIDVQGQ